MRKDGKNPYPHKFKRDFTLPQFREKYEDKQIEKGTFLEKETVSVTGRIMVLRASGAKLIFIDIHEDSAKIQIFATAANFDGDFESLSKLKRGDIIGVTGVPGRTNTGELSVRPTKIESLSYCMH